MTAEPAVRLRRDLIVHSPDDGGPVEIVDTLLERVVVLPADLPPLPAPGEAATGPAEDVATLAAWMHGELLAEGAIIDELRRAGWAARARRTVHAPALPGVDGPWALATTLPAWIATAWREPEPWRRLAEQRAAGTRLLRLPGLLQPQAAEELRAAVLDAATTRCDNPYARGLWDQDTAIVPWFRAAMHDGPLHTLLGAALAIALPARAQWNAWHLRRGDAMALHSDGTRYVATVSVGLSQGWRASDGGAIAFGTPGPDGLRVEERWLPHLGDVLAFAVEATLWHAVEQVHGGERITLTGQFLA